MSPLGGWCENLTSIESETGVVDAERDRRSVLTYHGDESRWQRVNEGVMLKAASRGQEFVLDCDHYPEAVNWLAELLKLAVP